MLDCKWFFSDTFSCLIRLFFVVVPGEAPSMSAVLVYQPYSWNKIALIIVDVVVGSVLLGILIPWVWMRRRSGKRVPSM